jgi:hypothetical protein
MTKLGMTVEFTSQVGRFYGIWAATELAIDYAIGFFLKLPPEETHLLTAGMEFNRKARLVMALIKRSDHTNKSQLLAALKIIQNESLRNAFAIHLSTTTKMRFHLSSEAATGTMTPKGIHSRCPRFRNT